MQKDLYKTFLYNYNNHFSYDKNIKSFEYYGSTPLLEYMIPKNTTHIIFMGKYNSSLYKCRFPKSVYSIKFDYSSIFYQEIKKNDLPETIIELIFENQYDIKLNADALPSKLERLLLSEYYNSSLTDTLGKNIKFVYLGDSYNRKFNVGDFPYGIEGIIIGKGYKRRIDKNVIPNSVKKLTLYNYNHKLKNVIPNSVIELYIGKRRKIKKGDISLSINNLTIGHNFNGFINKNVIPECINYLTIKGFIKNYKDENILPKYLKHLYFNYYEPDSEMYINHILLLNNLEELKFLKCETNIFNVINIKYIPKNILSIEFIGAILYNPNNISLENIVEYINVYSDDEIHVKNAIYSLIDEEYIINYNFLGLKINVFIKDFINKLIEENYKKEKLIGYIILEELVSKVFNPNRLILLSDKYNISFIDLLENY